MSQCFTSDQRKLWSVMNTVTGRKRSRIAPQVPPDQLSDVFGDVVVACNLRTCAVFRLHGAKYAVCRLHGTQSADCMVTVQTKDPRDSFSKFQRNLGFSARINFLTKRPPPPPQRKITSVFLTMVIICFLACNWGKQ